VDDVTAILSEAWSPYVRCPFTHFSELFFCAYALEARFERFLARLLPSTMQGSPLRERHDLQTDGRTAFCFSG
jgi:hypothetical protein